MQVGKKSLLGSQTIVDFSSSSRAITEKVTFIQGDSQDEGLESISSLHLSGDLKTP
jgi:hypothetical protein